MSYPIPLLVVFVLFPQDGLTDLDREVLGVLTETVEQGDVILHHAPGSIDPAELAEDVQANVAAFVELEEVLRMDFQGRVHVFLYPDQDEIERLTGVETFAFSTGARSVHQVHDFRGTHELVHVFATQFPAPEDAFTDGFVVEGLATGVTEFESGAPLHAWCAVYGKFGRLPGLWDLRGTFPDGVAAGVHPYHVAGSFVRFLIERFGVERVVRWYVEALEAKALLGESFVALEREWLAMLAGLEVDPVHEDVVRARLGLPREAPEGAWEERALFDGATLAPWVAEREEVWSVEDGRLVGRNDGSWTSLRAEVSAGASGVRVRFRVVGDAFRIELGGDGEGAPWSEAVLAAWASYLDAGGGYEQGDGPHVTSGFWNEAVLVRDGGRERLYLNEVLLFDVERDPAPDGAGALRVGLGVENGTVAIERVTCLVRAGR